MRLSRFMPCCGSLKRGPGKNALQLPSESDPSARVESRHFSRRRKQLHLDGCRRSELISEHSLRREEEEDSFAAKHVSIRLD